MRLIDADALSEHKFVSINCYLKSNYDNGYSRYKQGWNDAIDAIIYNAPIIEERPQGEWKKDEWGNISCSNCGRDTRNPRYPFFCCYCGTDMKGGRE